MSVKDTRQPLVTAPLPRPRSGRPVFTFLLAAAALGLAAYNWMNSAEVSRHLQQERLRLEAVDGRLNSLAREQRQLGDSDAMKARLLAEVQARLGTLDQSLSADQRRQWLLAEVDHYVRLAEQHLLLTRDVQGAKALLDVSDRLLAPINDNDLLRLRQAIAGDRLALDSAARIDTAGIYLRLAALSDRVAAARLPLDAGNRHEQGQVVAAPAEEAAPASLLAQGWQKFRDLITVRRYDEPVKPLLGDAERRLIQQNLQLDLGEAQLAVMRGEAGVYRAALTSARDRLARYFQQLPAPEYEALQRELQALADIDIRPAVPDLKASTGALDALRGKLPPAVTLDGRSKSQ